MAANTKPAAEPAPQSTYNSIAGLLGDWIRQGTEGFVATQKILLDLAAQQNALALTMVRERMGFGLPPSKKLADFVGQSIKNLIELQRQVLEIGGRQNSIISDGLKPAVTGAAMKGLHEVIHQGLDNFITTQEQFLHIIESQVNGAVSDYGEGKGFETARLADLARESTHTFLDGQKKLLDIIEEQLVTKKKAHVEKSKSGPQSVDILKMAKESVDALTQTEQRLLDLASEQVKSNVEFAREVFSMDAQPTTISEVAKKSVDSFVAAQKALVDLTSETRKTQHAGGKHAKGAAA